MSKDKMKKILSSLCAASMMATFAISTIAPANAAPIFVPNVQIEQTSDVVQIQKKEDFRRSGNSAYYNGHRGYKEQRKGYRQYNGFWFPAGAFIGGAISNGNNYNGGNAHVRWCYDRYRSYRASDNTFQPYHGPRQQCYSH